MSRAETFQIEPPPRQSSGSSRLLLGIGIGCLVMALICGGVVAGAVWWATDFFRNAFSVDPATIRAETARIATLDVPERLQPQILMRIDPPFVDELGRIAIYANEANEEALMLGDIRGLEAGDRSPSEVFREMNREQNFPGDGPQQPAEMPQNENDPNFEETSRESLERPVRGGTARFEIIQGRNKETEQERIIVYGTFPGHLGTGIFMMNVAAENSSLEDVQQVIESLE
jgi:hypothetical protein